MISDEKKNILIKVLNLTQSDKDSKALTAVRTANNILSELSVTWASIIDRYVCPHCNSESDASKMIEVIKSKNLPGSWTGSFISGLEWSYRKTRRLTQRQRDTLKRIYDSNQ